MSDLGQALSIFQEELNNIMQLFNDNREFNLIESNNPVCCFSLEYYDSNRINVHYNLIGISNEYLTHPNITHEKIEEIFRYLARHEYCHNLLCESFEVVEKFTEKQITKKNQITQFRYIPFENKFREYFADYKVKQYFSDIPDFFINNILNWLQNNRDLSFDCDGMLPMSFDNKYTIRQIHLYPYLQNLYRFHVCKCWNLLEPVFDRISHSSMLKFFFLIFEYFKKIIEEISEFEKKRDDLLEFVLKLDRYNYDKLVREDFLETEMERELSK